MKQIDGVTLSNKFFRSLSDHDLIHYYNINNSGKNKGKRYREERKRARKLEFENIREWIHTVNLLNTSCDLCQMWIEEYGKPPLPPGVFFSVFDVRK